MRPTTKRMIRRLTRRLGYEVVPARAGLSQLQVRLLPTIRLVVDVGANVGQYGEKIRSLGYRGLIVSFEPQLGAFGHLDRIASPDTMWECRRLAIGSEKADSIPLFNSENSVSSSLLRVRDEHVRAAPKAKSVGSELVDLRTLDDQFPQLPSDLRVWLKLDVQGHELEALAGAATLLDNCAAVQVELSFSNLYEGQASWLDVCALLMEAGLTLVYLEPGFEDPETGTMQQADAIFVRAEAS